MASDPLAYFFPNDGIVGLSSAFGVSADLGPATQSSADDYHESLLQSTLTPLCGSGGLELTDPAVVAQLLAAAGAVNPARSSRDTAGRPPGAATATTSKPARVIVCLQTATLRATHPRSPLPVGPGTSLLSRGQFSISCDGRVMPALPAIGDRAFGFPAGTLPCRHVALGGHQAVMFGVRADPDHVMATIVGRRGSFVVTVQAPRAISELTLRHGGHTLLTVRHRLSQRTIQFALTGPAGGRAGARRDRRSSRVRGDDPHRWLKEPPPRPRIRRYAR